MSAAVSHSVRGWCPGALRPMESGDGLIVRVRPRCGAMAISQLAAIADMADRYGNGIVDFTRRANIQVRGVTAEKLPELWAMLTALGLLDANAEAEVVRNVLVSPLAGIDLSEIADPRPLGRKIESMLAADARLWELAGKFGFSVDGGGMLSLDQERADVRCRFIATPGRQRVALGVDRPDGTVWLGTVSQESAAPVVLQIAQAFLALRSGPRDRMRDLTNAAFGELRLRISGNLDTLERQPESSEAVGRVGTIRDEESTVAVGLAMPFGRMEAKDLRALASLMAAHDVVEIRLSPWRTIYLPIAQSKAARALSNAAIVLGFVTDANDPLCNIDACPGSPGCRSTTLDTHAAARLIAPLLAEMGCQSCHVSGCAKGCARSKPADLVLVGAGSGFGLLRHGTAQDQPNVVVPPVRLGDVPNILKSL